VDSYLLEIEKTRENGTTEEVFQSKEPEVQLQQVLVDLFSAGFETVKTTLLWTIIHMLRNPEIKRKVQEELERVVGGNRLPCLDDMSRLNYSRACIYESMRRSLAVPLGTTHSNTR
jgi:26-hydroxylase